MTNLQYAPVVLRDRAAVEREDYRLANIVGLLEAIDTAKSKMRVDEDGYVEDLTKFSLRESQLKEAPLIFRLATFEYYVIVHESVKVACEGDGISGVVFTPTASYV